MSLMRSLDRRRVARPWMLVITLVAGLVPNRPASAQSADLSGGSTFKLYCASCHGQSAKGDGPLASSMKVRPPDLTHIAMRNQGVFPAEQVARTIDGRTLLNGHGRDMPVWGDAFAQSRIDSTSVAQRIQRLVTYLQSIQAK